MQFIDCGCSARIKLKSCNLFCRVWTKTGNAEIALAQQMDRFESIDPGHTHNCNYMHSEEEYSSKIPSVAKKKN